MKPLLIAAAALTLCAGCRPGSSGARADPHLGTLFAENTEVNALPENQSANFVASDFAVDSQGAVHFIATWGPTRAFGETVPHFNSSTYWRVSRDGTVVQKPGPRYASAVTYNLNVLTGPDDQPVFVQYSGLGPGKVISFFTANASGDVWAEKPFFFSNRPEGVTERAFNFATDQVRVLPNGQIAVLLQNHLMRSTADGWVEIPKPAGGLDFHLVNANAKTLRVVWTEAGNLLVTAAYSTADGSLDAASVVRTRLPGVPAFGANFNAAGSADAFTLDLDLDASWATYRIARC